MKHARASRYIVGPALCLALGQGIAAAQGVAAAPGSSSEGGGAVEAIDGGLGLSAGLERQVNLSPQEQLAQADGHLVRMEQSRSTARRQLMEAREQRDVVKTLCLNDKLSQQNVAIESAQQRRDTLAAAVKRADNGLAAHEYSILLVLRQRSDQLSAEANQCVGAEAGFIGQASVTSTVDTTLTKEDPSEYPTFGASGDIPQCSSCYD
jgi:hypothetical protein